MRKIQAVLVLLFTLLFGGTLYARHRSAPVNPQREIEGVLKSINDTQIVVTDNHNVDVPINVDENTIFRRGDMAIAMSDLKMGGRVEVKATEQGSVLLALLVRVDEQQEPEALELTGTIKNVSPSELVITDAHGNDTTVEITAMTLILKGDQPATPADLAIGDRVEVRAVKMGTTLNALLIKDEEEAPQQQPERVEVNGTIKNVSSSQIVVTDAHQHDATFSIDDHTIIRKNGRPAATTDLMIGDRVEVKALTMGTTSTALIINDETEQEEQDVEIAGSVKATGSNQITVTTRSADVVVKTDSNTRIRKDDRSIGLADIHVGDQVEAKGTRVDSTTILASEIEGRSGGSGGHH